MTVITMTREMGSLGKDVAAETRIRNIIVNHPKFLETGRSVDVVVNEGHVVLTGLVFSRQLADDLAHEIQNIEGVKSVTNNLAVPSTYHS